MTHDKIKIKWLDGPVSVEIQFKDILVTTNRIVITTLDNNELNIPLISVRYFNFK